MAAKKTMATKDLLDFEHVVGFNEKIKAYFEENARQIIAMALLICLIAAAIAYWAVSIKTSAQAAQNILNQALTTMSTPAQTEAEQTAALSTAITALTRAIDSYSSTEAGQVALFYRAQCKSRQNDHSGAIDDYMSFLKCSGSMVDQLQPFALENIGYAQEAQGNFAEALEWYGKAVEAGRDAARIGVARMHEAAGSAELACEQYQQYLANENTGNRDFVEMKVGDVCR